MLLIAPTPDLTETTNILQNIVCAVRFRGKRHVPRGVPDLFEQHRRYQPRYWVRRFCWMLVGWHRLPRPASREYHMAIGRAWALGSNVHGSSAPEICLLRNGTGEDPQQASICHALAVIYGVLFSFVDSVPYVRVRPCR